MMIDLTPLYLRTIFWTKDFFYGSRIIKPYKEIKWINEHNISDCRALLDQKLCHILEYAHENSEFYRKYDTLNLSDYPVVDKMTLIQNYDKVVVEEHKIPGQIGPIHIQTTSGSTGTPFAIPQDTLKRERRIAELKYYGKVVGYRSHEKLIHLRAWNRWQNKTSKQIRRENIIPFDISDMSDIRLTELCRLINDTKAVCLRGYASSFDLLANYIKRHPIKLPSLKLLIAGSETLQDDVRKKVKEYIGCEIISQYANEECGIIAQEQPPTMESDNVMYLNYAGYYIEFLKLDSDKPAEIGELGRIVLTDYHNHAFPIIRYDTGDVGVKLPANEKSNGFPILGKLYGRRLDVCYSADNHPISPLAIGRVLKHFNEIMQWQFIQKGDKQYLLKLCMRDRNISLNYINEIILALKEPIGIDSNIRVELVDEVPILASGKRKPIINEWKNGQS